jgi:AAHS family 3-hydroxyphenylpropionic acid transporter
VVPLLLIPLLMRWLPESQAFQRADQRAAAHPVCPGNAAATLLLWLGYFFTLLVVYMLINWLPMLLVGQGFSASQAAGVMFSLQIGAACGTLLLGALMDKLTPLRMSLLIYSGILASLLALGSASSLTGDAAGGVCRRAVRHRRAERALRAGAAVLSARRSAPPGWAPPWRWAVSGR